MKPQLPEAPAIFNDMLKFVIDTYRKHWLEIGKEAQPMLHVYKIEDDQITAHEHIPVMPFMENPRGKDALALLQKQIVTGHMADFNAYIFMSEMWFSTVEEKDGEKIDLEKMRRNFEHVPPSERPDRKEGIVFTAEMKGHAAVSKVFAIDRTTRTMKSPSDLNSGEASFTGRFAGQQGITYIEIMVAITMVLLLAIVVVPIIFQ